MADRDLAKIIGTGDLFVEDHGWLMLDISFEYEGGSGVQGLGYFADSSFILRLLAAVGVSSLQRLVGQSCWVTHTRTAIESIEPLHKKDGTKFVIKDWRKWLAKYEMPSPYEMRTGTVA